jgi:predicted PurR-regulated permease PerM
MHTAPFTGAKMRTNSLHKSTLPAPAPDPTPQPPNVAPVPVRNAALIVIATGVALFVLQQLQWVFVPFVLALLLFYALDPIVDWLQKWWVPRMIGAALALALAMGGVGVIAYLLQDEALTVVNQLPEGARKIATLFERRRSDEPGPMDKVQQAAETLQKNDSSTKLAPGVVRVQVEQPSMSAKSMLLWSGLSVLMAANQLVMILFLAYFMLLSDVLFKHKLVELSPSLAEKKLTVGIINDIARQIGQFLLIQLFTSAVVGFVTWWALWYMGLQQAALWGLLAGVFNSIPYYGPLIVSGGLAAVALLQFGTIGKTLSVAGVAMVITTLEGSLLTPMLMGKAAAMNRVTVFAGLLFWSWIWGIWGMLLAVPIMMVVKVVCDHVEGLQPIGRFMGE